MSQDHFIRKHPTIALIDMKMTFLINICYCHGWFFFFSFLQNIKIRVCTQVSKSCSYS